MHKEWWQISTDAYYTLEEAAKLLKLHPQTLRRWIHQGKLAAKRFGKQYRLRLEDLERAAQPAFSEAAELSPFDRMALASLAELWDNEEDAVYDDWKELYSVKEG
ncbi:MAG: helix-turn-helix domain-containing protein [Candidatus Bipolaricaulota bacterium]|nr:helix-turn-helix domain-containing protein [Candidatus Bipolaricaulota bacterium]